MTIGVFFGGRSPEHDISIITGLLIISEMKKMLDYNFIPVYLDKNGNWRLGQELDSLKFFNKDGYESQLDKLDKYSIDLEKSKDKLVFRKNGIFGKEVIIDFAFPAFHGMNGEDGTIQGLFEIFNIPYAGCDVTSSALAMDKVLTKVLYLAHGIETSEFVFFSKRDWKNKKEKFLTEIKNKLKYPMFIKPPKLGSSIGISRATNEQELTFGIDVALHYGDKVLIENGVENLVDITCAVMGNDKPVASLVQESSFSSDFFNYEEKYLNDGGAQTGNSEKNIIIPARLDDEITQKVRNQAIDVYNIFGCSGNARVDFLFDKVAKKIYVNEINTLPGNLYHHLWKASGIELDSLIRQLIDLGIEKYKEKNSYEYNFKSDILKSTQSAKLGRAK